MYSHKLTCLFFVIVVRLTLINAQFGGGFGIPQPQLPFARPQSFLNAGGSSGAFGNSNTNFQQNRGSTFGISAFGSSGSNTNFQQQNANGGFQNFGLNRGGIFRDNEENGMEENEMVGSPLEENGWDGNGLEENEMLGSPNEQNELAENQYFRYASPYDIPKYVPKPAYKPAAAPYKPAHSAPPALAPQVEKCGQNLFVSCVPNVQYVACAPPPSSSY
ncbi:uncharacterized protein LOC116352100 [Contarinia nasturtii]|uniref:uncharacterized protein LOC116352100 n=1 Tax=Contarinia nasturtii TaxID=265458 RepID=UPI0012D3CB9C|nr:uncharacterized protein LOC116352100 [Contarinia nasturtii]